MKRILITFAAVLIATLLMATSFDMSGELRSRYASLIDVADTDTTWVDSRLSFNFESQLHEKLSLAWKVEIGDLVWGKDGANIGTKGINIETSELYLDYQIGSLPARLRLGQMWWADHRSLILDDNFSGVMLFLEPKEGFAADLAYIYTTGDEAMTEPYHIFLADLKYEKPFSMGLLAMYGKNQAKIQKTILQADEAMKDSDPEGNPEDEEPDEVKSISKTLSSNLLLMPYCSLSLGALELDVTLLAEYQNLDGESDQWVLGAALKPNVELGLLSLGADLLAVQGDGISTLSSYYMNGLYLYGYGAHHDGVTNYENLGYEFTSENDDGFYSAVANATAKLKDNFSFLIAGGMLSNLENKRIGAEINAGLEYTPLEDMISFNLFSALGYPEAKILDRKPVKLFGAAVKVIF